MEEEKTITKDNTQVETKPKKKGHGCLITFLIILVLFVGVGLFLYFRIKYVLSNLGKEQDLGITYTQQDYDSLQEKVGIADVPEENVCIGCSAAVYSKAKNVDIVITSQEASAAFDIVNRNMPVGSIQNTQIKFSDDKVEISTLLTYEGNTFPIYVSGILAKATTNSITGEVFDVKAGPVKLPSGVNDMVKDGLLQIFNESLTSLGDNLRIDTLQITDQGLEFKGLVPTKIN
ncbi:MAG: hypothetical protein PHE21_02195 [Candidatus Dojkabacteria bacterium]|nr:hypothetical protein [Candidatus Dojkabacteria bacterium]